MLNSFKDAPNDRREYLAWREAELEKLEPFTAQLLEAERIILNRAIELCQGNSGEAAMRLGISRTTLWRKLGGKKSRQDERDK